MAAASSCQLQNNTMIQTRCYPSSVLCICLWTSFTITVVYVQNSGADPTFPVGGAPGQGATYNFAKISEKLHEIEKSLGRRGGRAPWAPPPSDSPLIFY